MKPLTAMLLLMLAFPLLYLAGAAGRSEAGSALALALVAAVCVLLLRPSGKA